MMRKSTLSLLLTLLFGVSFSAHAQYGVKTSTLDGAKYEYYIKILNGKYLGLCTTATTSAAVNDIINTGSDQSSKASTFIFCASSSNSDAYNIYVKSGTSYLPLVTVTSSSTTYVRAGSAEDTPEDFYLTKVVCNQGKSGYVGMLIAESPITSVADYYKAANGGKVGWKAGGAAAATSYAEIQGPGAFKCFTVETAAPAPMVFSSTTEGTLASYSTPIKAEIPSGVEAYYYDAESNTLSDNELTLTQITDGVIPAGQGIILRQTSSATATYYQPSTSTATSSITSDLKATSGATWSEITGQTVPASPYLYTTAITSSTTGYITVDNSTSIYGLSGNTFYNFDQSSTTLTMPPYKAYLETTTGGNALKLKFPDGSTTSINGVNVESTSNAAIYDLSGRRVNKTAKGSLYIQNGKKFIAE